MILSPLDNVSGVVLIKEISPIFIIEEYKRMDIDIYDFFQNTSKIFAYECRKSGYIFFYPFNLAGDGFFYEKLMRFDWYYNDWKWEHEICKKIINKNSKVLEVGCAKGDFLGRIKVELGADVTGLELNKKAISQGKRKGVPVFGETIQDHAIRNKEKYDVVCSFQVLEHISDVNSFLQSQVECLKKNGKLVIAVPNNDSFIKFDNDGILNFPPHHMGLWSPASIKSLENIFNIKLVGIYFEPLQEIHFPWFYFTQIRRLQANNKFIGKVVEKLTTPFYKPFLRLTKNLIKGHTMLAVFQK